MAPNALERWLRRAPLEPVQQQSLEPEDNRGEARDQQTAQPSSSEQEQQQQKAPAGTLEAYFTKRDDADTVREPEAAQGSRRRRPTNRFAFDWQVTGALGSCPAAWLHHRHAATFRQHAILESHAWQRQVLGGSPLSPEEAGAIQCTSFDSQGELLVAGSEEGLITVHSTAQLLAGACRYNAACLAAAVPPAQQAVGTADPLLLLDTHMPKLQALQWNPADENVVGVASSATRQLHLYDLQHTQGQPKQVLTIPQQFSSAAMSGSTAVGLTDLAFFGSGGSSSACSSSGSSGGGGYVVLASGMGGQVFLWDTRAKAAPTATLQAAHSGAIYAIQLAPDQQVVLAGTQSGEVKLWDLRGGSSSTLRFGGTVHHHPLLASVNIRYALTAVPGLASQTAIPASAVHSMQLDPCDPRRLAVHLGCGWSGLLDLPSAAITHLHAPAHAFAEEPPLGSHPGGSAGSQEGGMAVGVGGGAAASAAQMLLWASTAAPGLHRRACWMPDGLRFCVPSRREDSLLLLDFSPSSAAGCYTLREEQDQQEAYPGSSSDGGSSGRDGSQQWLQQAVPPAVHVPLSQAAICAAAHPRMDLLVAGSLSSCLSVAGVF